ncbi:MAG TPA: hypothetical protein VLG71_02615 [Candidatus Limnocylindria bacterium]|nr:hypothetical protein [Candidatus Limnocylindria bacterium]
MKKIIYCISFLSMTAGMTVFGAQPSNDVQVVICELDKEFAEEAAVIWQQAGGNVDYPGFAVIFTIPEVVQERMPIIKEKFLRVVQRLNNEQRILLKNILLLARDLSKVNQQQFLQIMEGMHRLHTVVVHAQFVGECPRDSDDEDDVLTPELAILLKKVPKVHTLSEQERNELCKQLRDLDLGGADVNSAKSYLIDCVCPHMTTLNTLATSTRNPDDYTMIKIFAQFLSCFQEPIIFFEGEVRFIPCLDEFVGPLFKTVHLVSGQLLEVI